MHKGQDKTAAAFTLSKSQLFILQLQTLADQYSISICIIFIVVSWQLWVLFQSGACKLAPRCHNCLLTKLIHPDVHSIGIRPGGWAFCSWEIYRSLVNYKWGTALGQWQQLCVIASPAYSAPSTKWDQPLSLKKSCLPLPAEKIIYLFRKNWYWSSSVVDDDPHIGWQVIVRISHDISWCALKRSYKSYIMHLRIYSGIKW